MTKIPPQESCAILDLGSAILKLNMAQYSNMGLPETILKYWAALGFNMLGSCGDEEMIRDV